MDIAKKKSRIIEIVEGLQNDKYINWIWKVLEVIRLLPNNSSFTPPPVSDREDQDNDDTYLANLFEIAKQPMPDHIPLEQLIVEQNYDPKNLVNTLENWDHRIFDDDPPIEEILKMKI